MAENKDSFKLYTDQQGLFNELPDDQAGRLIKLIFSYVNDENPEPEELLLRVAFEPIKRQLKRDLKKYRERCEKNTENIRKRWDEKDTNVYDCKKTDTNHTDKIREDKIREDKKYNKKCLMKNSGLTLEQVSLDFLERDDLKNANAKYYYQAAMDWSDSKGEMRKDWMATVRSFARRDLADNKLKIKSSVTASKTNAAPPIPEDYGKPSETATPMPDSLKKRIQNTGKFISEDRNNIGK